MAKKMVVAPEPDTPSAITPHRPPLIFISHDSRDAALAEAFENLLSDASGGVLRAFRSSDRKGFSGIEFGAEWYTTIMAKLGEATDVVALLTPNSVSRPWILYEVGVARGKLDKPAFGVTFGLSLDRVTGPFAQFQNCADDEDSLTKLVLQLIRRNPDASPREEAVRRQVAAFKTQLPKVVQSAEPRSTTSDPEAIAKLFEEVKVMFRELPDVIVSRLPRGSRLPLHDGDRSVISQLHDTAVSLGNTADSRRASRWRSFARALEAYCGRPVAGGDDIYEGLKRRDFDLLARGRTRFKEFAADERRRADSGEFVHLFDDVFEAMEVWGAELRTPTPKPES